MVELPPVAVAGSDGLVLGDEAALLGVRLRGFAVSPDDAREVLPLGRFGVASRGRSTTLPATAVDSSTPSSPGRRTYVKPGRAGVTGVIAGAFSLSGRLT